MPSAAFCCTPLLGPSPPPELAPTRAGSLHSWLRAVSSTAASMPTAPERIWLGRCWLAIPESDVSAPVNTIGTTCSDPILKSRCHSPPHNLAALLKTEQLPGEKKSSLPAVNGKVNLIRGRDHQCI